MRGIHALSAARASTSTMLADLEALSLDAAPRSSRRPRTRHRDARRDCARSRSSRSARRRPARGRAARPSRRSSTSSPAAPAASGGTTDGARAMTSPRCLHDIQQIQAQLASLGRPRRRRPRSGAGVRRRVASGARRRPPAAPAACRDLETASTDGALVSPNGVTGDDVVDAALEVRACPTCSAASRRAGSTARVSCRRPSRSSASRCRGSSTSRRWSGRRSTR